MVFIKQRKFIPEYVIKKIPQCDECGTELDQENYVLPTAPLQYAYKCPKCEKVFRIPGSLVEDEWVWKEIP